MNGEGMESPGRGKWFEEHKDISPDFHLDPTKERDPVEDLLRYHTPEDAVAVLEEKLKSNPDDGEARRQLNLIHNRLQDLLSHVGGIVKH
jgi:hypothetical protein